jgi:type IV pilus assembly protein PilN
MQPTTRARTFHFIKLIHYIGLTLFALLVWHVTLYDLVIYQQESNAQLSALINKKKTEISLFEKRQNNIIDYAARIHFITGLYQENRQAAQLLQEIAKALPIGITLEQIQRQDKHMILNGNAQSDVNLIHFMQNINKSTIFMQPVITSLNTLEQSRVFQLKVEIKP